MKLVIFLIFFVLVYFCDCKKNVQSLSESTGQDVIEIGTPIKELPPGVEEEPSAEAEEELATDETTRLTSKPPASIDSRRAMDVKTRVATTTNKPPKDKDDSEETSSQEEEEARIEKELAEIYKDTDYKSEGIEVPKEVNVTETEENKPIARTRTNFKFQPDVNSRQDIERFRTSVDEISCERRVTQRLKNLACDTASPKLMMLQFGLLILSLGLFY